MVRVPTHAGRAWHVQTSVLPAAMAAMSEKDRKVDECLAFHPFFNNQTGKTLLKHPLPSRINMTTSTAVSPSPTKSALLTEAQQDVPIFLRKTFHMVDTCDPSIAGWSDDGETFIVKDPVKFEKQIIPQFFKHSKFTSFVRQLNFYAFRKIKYADSIRIDPKLEAETANYWRFRHEKFLRGKPELLSEIKRMNGQKAASNTNSSQPKVASTLTPQEQENSKLKSEVSSLKERLEAMTKNIDELTSMVHKVTLATKVPDDDAVLSNKKRAKVEAPTVEEDLTPDYAPSAAPVMASPDLSPCSATSCMELDAFALPPSMPSPHPMESRPPSGGSDMTDEGFVDYLFTAFNTEDLVEMPELPQPPENNRPRPELMNRLSDALSALPRDIQELIVDRLIQAIASPVTCMGTIEPCKDPQQIANLQLAAATLAALLGQCSGDSKLSNNNNSHKALLIPVHA